MVIGMTPRDVFEKTLHLTGSEVIEDLSDACIPLHLAAGDYVVLVSDGLLVDGPGWVMQQLELSAAKAEQPDVLAKKLVEAARARAVQRGRPDDITAAVLRLENS